MSTLDKHLDKAIGISDWRRVAGIEGLLRFKAQENKPKITQEDVDRALDDHKVWLESRGESGQRAEFIGENLDGLDLSDSDLSGADFSKASLAGVDFKGSLLEEAEFYGANLSGADLSYSEASGADFFSADLSGAKFNEADLAYTSFDGANLVEADFSDAKLQDTSFDGADMEAAIGVGSEEEAAPVSPSLDPDQYHQQHGRCPKGYHWDGSKCVPSH